MEGKQFVTVSFPIGSIPEKATDALRWGTAFAVVASVYGVGAWLLLRQNPSGSDPGGWVVLDLPRMPEFPLAPGERGAFPASGVSERGAPSEALDAGARAAQNERTANLGEAGRGTEIDNERPAGPDGIKPAGRDQPSSDPATPEKGEPPAATGGSTHPVLAARPSTARDGGVADLLAKMPIDTRITVYQARPFSTLKGVGPPKQLLGVRQLNVQNELKQLQERLFKRPVSIAAVAPNHVSSAGHAPIPSPSGAGAAERNAIGILVEHHATSEPAVLPGQSRQATAASASGPLASGPLGIPVAVARPSSAREAATGDAHAMQGANHGSSGPVTATAAASAGINGTGMTRAAGSMTAFVGGPTRTSAGIINGTSFRARVP